MSNGERNVVGKRLNMLRGSASIRTDIYDMATSTEYVIPAWGQGIKTKDRQEKMQALKPNSLYSDVLFLYLRV